MRIKGKEVSSTAMIMTGTDSLGDALVSIGIIAAIIIYRLTGVNIENYICIAISLMILYTGIGVLRESVAKILGTRNDEEYVAKIRSLLIMEEGVLNINNLVIHNYGENRYYGSADIEVNEEMRASQITKISRRLIRHAKKEGLILTSVGISGTNISDPEATEIWDKILGLIMNHEFILRAHSFAIDLEENVISFYVVLDYSVRDRVQLMKKFREELAGMYPDMTIEIFEAIDI
jgi:divalent metal cation (Fe/Co/Zn/Cd) transporter